MDELSIGRAEFFTDISKFSKISDETCLDSKEKNLIKRNESARVHGKVKREWIRELDERATTEKLASSAKPVTLPPVYIGFRP